MIGDLSVISHSASMMGYPRQKRQGARESLDHTAAKPREKSRAGRDYEARGFAGILRDMIDA
jgi:hypothetical protein